MRIGVLGGTFDPVHLGHLTIAEEARWRLELEYVIFVPAGQPWLKTNRNISPAVHRMTMLRLAIEGNESFRLSNVEIEREGPSYTVDTLDILRDQIGEKTKFFFLLGCDALAQLPRWKEPEKLVKICNLVAFPRSGITSPDLRMLEKLVPGVAKTTIELDIPTVDVSSSDIRKRIAHDLPINGMVPQTVEEYIRIKGLYASMGKADS